MANRVCTTERSSANPRITRSRAAEATGVSSTPQIATVLAVTGTRSRNRTTSVVVPLLRDREHGVVGPARPEPPRPRTRRSLPSPRPHGGDAYAWATNHDVPQPMAATRSPWRGERRWRPRAQPRRPVANTQAGWRSHARFRSFERTILHERSSIATHFRFVSSLYSIPMRQADRLSVILEDLSDGGSVSVSDLSRRLGVSAATIRRDLGLLEENRLLRRTHGGAVTQGLLYELPLRYKSARHQEEKTADRSGRRRAGARGCVPRSDRRHHDDRGRSGAGRSRAAHDRDERVEHRVGAGRATEPPPRGHRWDGAERVLRAGRPARRGEPGRDQPGSGDPRASTGSRWRRA